MVAIAHMTSLYDGVDATSFVTASITPGAEKWLVADIWSRDDAGTIAAPVVSGFSLTWVTEHTKIGVNPAQQVSRFYAWTGGGPGSGSITFDFSPATHDAAAWIVYQITGADTTDPFVQSVSVEQAGGTSISVTLAAFGSSDNRPLICAAHRADEVSTQKTDYAEIGDVRGAAPLEGFAAAWLENAADTTPSYSWATSASDPQFAIASEIKAAIDLQASLPVRRQMVA